MKALALILSGTWKFAMTFPLALLVMNMSAWETLLYINLGGIIGVLAFVFLSKLLISWYDRYWPESWKPRKKNTLKSWKRHRKYVRFRDRYGFPGIVILSPVLLSIPVGAFLVTRFYGTRIRYLLWLIAGQLGWSIIYTLFYLYVREMI